MVITGREGKDMVNRDCEGFELLIEHKYGMLNFCFDEMANYMAFSGDIVASPTRSQG